MLLGIERSQECLVNTGPDLRSPILKYSEILSKNISLINGYVSFYNGWKYSLSNSKMLCVCAKSVSRLDFNECAV